jgi:hypothetical protein
MRKVAFFWLNAILALLLMGPLSGNASQAVTADSTVSRAYQAAHTHPEVFSKLFCYCGCDRDGKHSSLLDCFASDHGKQCPICQAEELMADGLIKQGKPVTEIRRAIDSTYSGSYPAAKPSAALLRYRQNSGS